MGASSLVILWHKVLLSPPCWFLLEVFAKKPWKWSIYSSIAVTSLFPILVLVTLTLGSITLAIITLVLVQCGLLTLAFISLISSAAVIVPVALLLTFSLYVIYKSTLVATRAVCWVLVFPTDMLKNIQANFIYRVDTNGSKLSRNPCLSHSLDKKQQKHVSEEVRSEATRGTRKTRTQRSLKCQSEFQNRGKFNPRQQEQGFSGCFDQDSDGVKTRIGEELQKTAHSGKKSEGWSVTWLNQQAAESNSSFSDSECLTGTCFHNYEFQNSGSQRNVAFTESKEESLECSSQSNEETMQLSSGSSSDSYHTAEEWIAEDYIGNVIPDYRDRETKLYDALLKKDFCNGHGVTKLRAH